MNILAPRDLVRAFNPAAKTGRNLLRNFSEFNHAAFAKLWARAGEEFWQNLGARRALALFHAAAERVPAYKNFLKQYKIVHAKVKTIKDFGGVPCATKENYIRAYPLAARMWDGKIGNASLMAVSSGTSGEPVYWPRGGYQEFEAAVIHDLLYRSFYGIAGRSTLLVVGFPVGIYVSGVATLIPSSLVAARGYPLTVAAVGNNRGELVRTLAKLAPQYEQVVIAAHPFFIKDALETARAEKIALPKRLFTFMCSEGFSEAWRTHLAKLAGSGERERFLGTYGSSELLLMAYETPLTLAVRSVPAFQSAFAKRMAVPMLFQYNPFFRYIESVHDELVFTSYSGTPLVRFNLHDSGDVVPHREMLGNLGVRAPRDGWRLPFITLHGRSDRTLVFYAANIYPEHVKAALDHPEFHPHVTGKFLMRKDYMNNMDQFLEVNVELREGVRATRRLLKKIEDGVHRTLRKLNLEYVDTSTHHSKDLRPRVRLWAYQHPAHFPPGVKPKYIAS